MSIFLLYEKEKDDIGLLLDHFLDEAARELAKETNLPQRTDHPA